MYLNCAGLGALLSFTSRHYLHPLSGRVVHLGLDGQQSREWNGLERTLAHTPRVQAGTRLPRPALISKRNKKRAGIYLENLVPARTRVVFVSVRSSRSLPATVRLPARGRRHAPTEGSDSCCSATVVALPDPHNPATG